MKLAARNTSRVDYREPQELTLTEIRRRSGITKRGLLRKHAVGASANVLLMATKDCPPTGNKKDRVKPRKNSKLLQTKPKKGTSKSRKKDIEATPLTIDVGMEAANDSEREAAGQLRPRTPARPLGEADLNATPSLQNGLSTSKVYGMPSQKNVLLSGKRAAATAKSAGSQPTPNKRKRPSTDSLSETTQPGAAAGTPATPLSQSVQTTPQAATAPMDKLGAATPPIPRTPEPLPLRGEGGRGSAGNTGGAEDLGGAVAATTGHETVRARPSLGDSPAPGTRPEKQLSAAQTAFLQELEVLLGAMDKPADAAATHPPGTVPLTDELKEARDEAAYWKDRYQELANLRETEVEKHLREYRTHVEEKERAQQELIAHLREQMTAANTPYRPLTQDRIPTPARTSTLTPEATNNAPKLDESVVRAAAPIPEVGNSPPKVAQRPTEPVGGPVTEPGGGEADSAYVRGLQDKNMTLRRLILLYQAMSSLVIKVKETEDTAEVDEDATLVECYAINHLHKRAVKFELKVPEHVVAAAPGGGVESGNAAQLIQFWPTGNVHLLPKYMQVELSFPKEKAPLFLTKMLQALFTA